MKRLAWIDKRLSEETGAILLYYDRRLPQAGRNFDGPRSGEYCYYHRHDMPLNGPPLSTEQAIVIADASNAARKDDLDRARLDAVLAGVNQQRATIAFCALAMAVVSETQHQINEYRTILSR